MQRKGHLEERRKFVRIAEEDLLVCEPFDWSLFGGVMSKRIRTFTKNLSENGLLFEADEPYGIGDLLKLQVDLPGWEKYKSQFYRPDDLNRNQPLVILGKVVRVEDIGGGIFDIGVVFTAVDSNHRAALRKYLESDKGKK